MTKPSDLWCKVPVYKVSVYMPSRIISNVTSIYFHIMYTHMCVLL